MKTLIVYDTNGQIIMSMQNSSIDKNCKCIISDIKDNKIPVSVDINTEEVITKDKPLTIEEQNEILTDQIIELTAQNLINN